jgi:hypothetical protein
VKTLVAGAVAVLSFAALTLLFATPAAADDATPTPPAVTSAPPPAEVLTPGAPAISAKCSSLGAIVFDLSATRGRLGVGWGPASNGEPPITQVTGPDVDSILDFFEPGNYNVTTAMNWRVVVWRSDGTVAWDEHGTTTPCPAAPVVPKSTLPVLPPEPPCGSTMDDVTWPSTPGIVYSHDQWFAFARLQPGWQWDQANYKPGIGWGIMGDSDLAYVHSEVVLDITGHCGIDRPSPPESAEPGSKCWYQLPHPAPCPTPEYYVPRTPIKMSAPPTTTTFPVPPADATASALTPAPTHMATTSPASPSPAPSPSATPAVQATPRVGTSTGLGVAGGLAGACVLAAAGAFVVRRRLHPSPAVEMLDEAVGDERVD